MQRSFPDLLRAITAVVHAGDGAAFAEVFTEDGIYEDVFYGVFQGREAIADRLENYFRRGGENFLWRMYDPLDDGATGYAR